MSVEGKKPIEEGVREGDDLRRKTPRSAKWSPGPERRSIVGEVILGEYLLLVDSGPHHK